MKGIRDKYELILGFAMLIISIGAFRDDLKDVLIDAGFFRFTLLNYALTLILGFAVCLYLYILERVARDSWIGTFKAFDWVLRLAYFIFVMILISPIMLGATLTAEWIHRVVVKAPPESSMIMGLANTVAGFVLGVMSYLASGWIFKQSKIRAQRDVEREEIEELESALRLFSNGFYSSSIVESFRVIETHLIKRLSESGSRPPRNAISTLLPMALTNGILDKDDFVPIMKLQEKRNRSVHNLSVTTKEEAENAIKLVRNILNRG